MRIVSSRKDDVLRRKAEYEADFNKRKLEYDTQLKKYYEARATAVEPVKNYFENLFSKYPLLHADIRVEGSVYGDRGIRVEIIVDENNKFKDNISLSWNYDAYINQGQVVRETSSWSGMSAVTSDQLAHLEQSLSALKDLANVDWDRVLNITLPDYTEYISVTDPRFDRDKPNFKQELLEAELDDLVGQRKVIEVEPFDSSWFRGPSFVAIVRDTGKQYVIKQWSRLTNPEDISGRFDTTESRRVKKSSIIPVEPINIVEV